MYKSGTADKNVHRDKVMAVMLPQINCDERMDDL